ncbi:MAG: glycosyltransferase family 4 protein [Thermoplasmata archaeon]|nr:MAG: glycosyltransferase family 4 protein [Thermoplasmata archaeon]
MISPIKYHEELNSIVFIGNYLPRRCGIATFTTDLLGAVSAEITNGKCSAIVMNDIPEGYVYPPQVRFEINQNKLSDYKQAAEFLNMNQIDIVCLQHEYGIFGGPAGSNIIQLLNDLRMPVVTTLHTVLKEVTHEQALVVKQLIDLSDRLVVMSEKAREFLIDIHSAPEEKIVFIHHGIPDTPFIDPSYYKDQFGVEGKKVILTFGLLSPNKGIEYMIQALPQITKKHPDIAYIILGATHPHVLKAHGEEYRLNLQRMARKLDVAEHVIFQNRFVTLEELCEFLGTADIYVTPYTAEEQIVSGTLSYALGTGKATISTPYWYAKEMLADRRGYLVPFKNPDALADMVINLLDNHIERNAMRKRAYTYSRSAIWKEVARRYLEVFSEVKSERSRRPRTIFYLKRPQQPIFLELPEINLNHVNTLTDDTGILQHAIFNLPNRVHGYCTDDNARALMLSAMVRQFMPPQEGLLSKLCTCYLSFLHYAFNEEIARFRNFKTYDRRWLEEQGSEDSHGRAIWGLGVSVSCFDDPGLLSISATLFNKALVAAEGFISLRAMAFALVGIHAYLARFPGDSAVRRTREVIANRLYEAFNANCLPDWPWCEDVLTYANGKLPHALILSGQWMYNSEMLTKGLQALEWLAELQLGEGHYIPIGNNNWYKRTENRARFDQQPLEAHSMIDACIEAFNVTQDKKWIDRATTCFNWFLGDNDLHVSLYNPRTGGCRDGLNPDGVNPNEGAESTLAWLLSLTALHKLAADNILSINSYYNKND